MTDSIQPFLRDENGAVSAEFVVVSAAMVSLGIAVLATLADGTIDTAVQVNSGLETSTNISYSSRPD